MWLVFAIIAAIVAAIVASVIYQYPSPRQPLSFLDVQPNNIELSDAIQNWYRRGNIIRLMDSFDVFSVFIPCNKDGKKDEDDEIPTFVFIHGFPSSSFDYSEIADELSEIGNVLVHDHIGFGFSSKPDDETFRYSIYEHADIAVSLYNYPAFESIRDIVLVCHDMGDTICSELLVRAHHDLLPRGLAGKIKGVVFTNGGMHISLSQLRLSQKLLVSPLGWYLNKIIMTLDAANLFSAQQLKTVWAPSYNDTEARNLAVLHINQLLLHRGGRAILDKTIRYIRDRREWETRWMHGVSAITASKMVRCLLLWGDSDAVAPLAIAHAVVERAPLCELHVLKNVGHFVMLGKWLRERERK